MVRDRRRRRLRVSVHLKLDDGLENYGLLDL